MNEFRYSPPEYESNMFASDEAIEFIKGWEGVELEAYQDIADIWTIGSGHTGSEVHEGMVITEEAADALLRDDVRSFENCVNSNLERSIEQREFDALVCLSYNIGCGALSESTIIKRVNLPPEAVNDNTWRGPEWVSEAITWWNKSTVNGKLVVVDGLVKRRAAERNMFLHGDYSGRP